MDVCCISISHSHLGNFGHRSCFAYRQFDFEPGFQMATGLVCTTKRARYQNHVFTRGNSCHRHLRADIERACGSDRRRTLFSRTFVAAPFTFRTLGTRVQRRFVFLLSLLDTLDVLFTPNIIDTPGLYRKVEAEHLYRDDRTLFAESDRYCRIVCTTTGIIRHVYPKHYFLNRNQYRFGNGNRFCRPFNSRLTSRVSGSFCCTSLPQIFCGHIIFI